MACPRPPLILIVLCLIAGIILGAAAQSSLLDEGMEAFKNGQWDKALAAFQQAAAAATEAGSKAEASLWIAKTQLAAGKISEAAAGIEEYLVTWPETTGYEEALFLKGRVLSQLGQLELAVQTLQSFIARYPTSAFAASAWYWAGESLYGLGRLDEAQTAYQKVVHDWPESSRAEAAQQKVSLITVERRAEELARLLQWSHEEFLRSSEDYQRRAKVLQQTVDSLQKRLSAAGTTETVELERTIEALRTELAAKDAEIARLSSAAGTASEGAAPAASAAAAPASSVAAAPDQTTQKLLKAKLEALALKERILAWLQAHEGAK